MHNMSLIPVFTSRQTIFIQFFVLFYSARNNEIENLILVILTFAYNYIMAFSVKGSSFNEIKFNNTVCYLKMKYKTYFWAFFTVPALNSL